MKRFLVSFVAAIALTVLVTVPIQAQVTRDKKPPGGLGGLTTPVNKPGSGGIAAGSVPLPKYDVLGLLTIESISLNRYSGSLQAVIKSAAIEPLEATYTFSRWDGKKFSPIGETKKVTVLPKRTETVTAPFRRGADAERLKLVVINTAHKVNDFKELKLEALPLPVKFIRFDAVRRNTRVPIIGITGELANTTPQNLEGMTYSLSQWNGKRWIPIDLKRSGAKSLQSQATTNVLAELPVTKDAVKVKLEVGAEQAGVRYKQPTEYILEAKTTPSTFTLISLECTKTNDADTDRLELRGYVGDPRADGVLRTAVMKAGQTWKIDLKPRPFPGEAKIELWEIDPEAFDKDDKLGTVVIRLADGFGEHRAAFTGGGAVYKLLYRIDP